MFYRDGNRLLPTDTGRIVIEKSSEILQLAANMNDAVDSTKNLKRGKVTLGCPSIVASLYLSELLIEFQRIYPEISFHLIEAGGAELTRLTASGEIDLAIVMRPIYSDLLNEIPIVKKSDCRLRRSVSSMVQQKLCNHFRFQEYAFYYI